MATKSNPLDGRVDDDYIENFRRELWRFAIYEGLLVFKGSASI